MAKLTKRKPARIDAPDARRPTLLGRDLTVLSAGHAPRKHEWIHHGFGFVAVGFVVEGRGTYQVDGGGVTPIGPGSLFSVWPGPVFHYGATDGKSPPPSRPGGVSAAWWDEYHACFSGPGIERLARAGLLWRTPAVRTVGHVAEHVARWRELLALFRREGAGDADRAALLAERLLLELYLSRETGEPRRQTPPGVEAVIAHCRRHFSEPIDFGALARRHAMSYSLLRQRVREATGLPPGRLVHQLRCDAARELLRETDLPVKAVAGRVGVEDPYEFSRLFKRTVGVSPREFRRRSAVWRMGG